MNNDVRRRLAGIAAIFTAAVVLAGCATTQVSALERTAEPDDALPVNLTGSSGFDPATARHVATRGEVDFYLAKQTGDLVDGVCLVVTKEAEPLEWASSCSAGEWFGFTWAPGHVNAEFYRRGVTAGDVKPGWTQLSENVIAED